MLLVESTLCTGPGQKPVFQSPLSLPLYTTTARRSRSRSGSGSGSHIPSLRLTFSYLSPAKTGSKSSALPPEPTEKAPRCTPALKISRPLNEVATHRAISVILQRVGGPRRFYWRVLRGKGELRRIAVCCWGVLACASVSLSRSRSQGGEEFGRGEEVEASEHQERDVMR